MKARQEGKKNLLSKGSVSLMFRYCRKKQLVLRLSMKGNVIEQLVCLCSCDVIYLIWSQTLHTTIKLCKVRGNHSINESGVLVSTAEWHVTCP